MKPAPTSTALDAFIRDAIKSPGNDLPLVDWSEVEVLLRHEKKPISFNFNVDKKIIWGSSAALAIIVVVIIILKTVSFNSATTEETPSPPSDLSSWPEAQQPAAVNTQKTDVVHDSVVAKIDSSAFIAADTTAHKKTNDKESRVLEVVKAVQKQDKKQKDNSVSNAPSIDSSVIKKNDFSIPTVDTASAPPSQEIKISEERPAADTTGKTNATSKKNSKRKKSKPEKTVSPEAQLDTLKPK